MPMLMMMVVVVVIVVIIMVMMHMACAFMRLVFHPQPKDCIHRGCATCDRNNRRRGWQLVFNNAAGTRDTVTVQHIRLRQHNQVGSTNLVGKQLINRAFMIQFLISSALCLQRIKIMRHTAIRKRRAIHQRHHTVKHHLRLDIRPVERLNKRLRQRQT